MIDSHCHLADPKFEGDLDAVLQRAKEAGVERCMVVADTIPEARKCVALAEGHAQLFATVGVHPHAAKEWNDESEAVLRDLAKHPKVRAIGEIGLDYHYDHSPRDVQREVFRAQLKIAHDLQLPAVVHCREAIGDVRAVLQDFASVRAVIHCCTETWDDVRPIVDAGVWLSFTGIATYANADAIRDVITRCPITQMMIETDSPYLAPVPHRGKRNEPAHVAEVAALIATLKGLSVEEVDRVTTQNTVAFFGLPPL